METLIGALISAGSAITVCLISSHYQLKNTREQHDKTVALIEYKLDELTKRVDKHNNVVERTYELEKHMAVVENKIEAVENDE